MKRNTGSRLPGGTVLWAVLAALALAVVGLGILDRERSDHLAEGITVDGVEIGGRSAAEAEATVRAEVARPLRRTIVAVSGERRFRLSPRQARLEIDVEATVDAAVERSREGTPGIRAVGDLLGVREVDAEIEPRMRYSEQAVRAFIGRVAGELEREARDATLEVSGAGLEVTPSREGFEVDRRRLRNRVTAALEARGRRVVGVPGGETAPQVTRSDLAERHPDYIVVDRDGFRLLHYEDLELKSEYPISVGDIGQSTPAGEYDISTKAVDPTWYVPDSEWAGDLAGEVIPPGPDNPLKSRWLGIEDGIGIHGTDVTSSIGSRASAGCIRMLIPDVEELYDRVPVGTSVYIA